MYTQRKKPEVSTAIILEKRITNKMGKHPVKLRITFLRKRKYYAIKGEHYNENEFQKIYGEKPRRENKERRRKLDAVENRAIDIIENVLLDFSFEDFEYEYLTHKKDTGTIQSYFETKVDELNKANKLQTATLYKATINSLQLFDKRINFNKITAKYLKSYENWMISNDKSYTTIGIYLRNLKYIINKAIKNKMMSHYPFGIDKDKYQIPKGHNIKKALKISDIEKLFRYKPKKENERIALHYWLFSYLCNGMNMIDIANLKFKNIQGNNLKFIRQKTRDTTTTKVEIDVLLLPEAMEIIKNIGNKNTNPNDYIFPIFNQNLTETEKFYKNKQHIKNTNKHIRNIAREIGIDEKISTYWARHSYSTILKRSGAPIEFISEQLGHQGSKVTQNYLDTFEDEQKEKYSSFLLDFKKKRLN